MDETETIGDYCEFFAENMRAAISENGVNIRGAVFFSDAVYSQTNPARVWAGTPTVEFMTREVRRVHYLAGTFRDVHEIELAARTANREQANGALFQFRRFLSKIGADMIDAGKIDDFILNVERIYPDQRGNAVGESFYAVIPFSIFEKTRKDF